MIIYKTVNLINGKIYIGRDCVNDSNYYGSGKYYQRAEKKYGKENFKKIVIDKSNDFKELCFKEIFWIDFYNARNSEIGYNIAPGGEGFANGEKHPLYGKHLSDEHKQNVSNALKGRMFSKEHRAKLRELHKGKLKSEAHKLKMSINSMGNKNAIGKRSEEFKLKRHNDMLGKKRGPYKKKDKETQNELRVF